MRFYLFTALSFVLLACGSKDTKMCDCLEVSDRLNQLSSELLINDVTPAQKKEMKSLQKQKDKKCKDFQTMSGEEMLKLKEDCQ